MTPTTSRFAALSDTDLLAEITRLAAGERHATVQLIASLMELDARRLYLGQGCREPKLGSRHIPSAVHRLVWARDEGRCTFAGPVGRCAERGFLEFHHVVPYAAGSEATADTIALRCRAHNQYEAGLDFGPRVPRRRGDTHASASQEQ